MHIRGGDIDQVGYELDGIPVNRAYDNAPQTMLSSLGSQEVQVYTGGVPASSDAQGISGYVNQVIKTGTYPGYGDGKLSVGYPAFYHQASIEAGGSTPDRLFSYYVGIGGSNQDFRFVDNNNGAEHPDSFFYPVSAVPGVTCGLIIVHRARAAPTATSTRGAVARALHERPRASRSRRNRCATTSSTFTSASRTRTADCATTSKRSG